MGEFFKQILQTIGAYVPNLLGALAILIIGWIGALIIAAISRSVISRTSLGKKLPNWLSLDEDKPIPVANYISKTIFYLLMLFVLIAFFQALKLTLITEPLNNLLNQIFIYAPRFFGAILLLVVAWVLATVLRFIVTKLLTTIKLDERLSAKIEEEKAIALSSTIANSVYWLIFLLFLPAVLNSLQMQGILEPIRSMLDKMLNFLPNIFTAGLILVIGWFLAKIICKIVSNLLEAVGVNTLSDKVGLEAVLGKEKLSDLLGLIIYVLILIPVLLITLDALMLEAITTPVSNMLNLILKVLPSIFAAILIISISYIIAKLVSKLVSSLLAGAGFDKFAINLGVMKESKEDGHKASNIVGYLTLIAILFFAVIEAFEVLGFTQISEIVAKFTVFSGNILLGIIIFGLGLFLANIVSNKILTKETAQLKLTSLITRVAILFIAGAMALQQMGIGSEIVTLAFGLILGAIAIAVAVAFGIGGRDIASKHLLEWSNKLETKE
ncbi:MAG: mechanosensitive ion channel [Pseudomonadota bacterium]